MQIDIWTFAACMAAAIATARLIAGSRSLLGALLAAGILVSLVALYRFGPIVYVALLALCIWSVTRWYSSRRIDKADPGSGRRE